MRKKFLHKMIEMPSPSGSEQNFQKWWMDEMNKYVDNFITDNSGNVAAVLNPSGKPKVMISAHCDEIRLCVRGINDYGFIFLGEEWTHDLSILPANSVIIHTKKGDVPGVIGHPPIHLLGQEIDQEPKEHIRAHNLWIDVGAKNKEEIKKLGIGIGDPVTFSFTYKEICNRRIAGRGMDNKIGVFAVSEVLRELHQRKRKYRPAVYVVLSVREETNMAIITMANKLRPDLALVVDVTHAVDNPILDTENWDRLGNISLEKGPVIGRGPDINPKIFELLEHLAEQKKIPHQIEALTGSNSITEATFINLSRTGLATGLVSIPARYIHTPVGMASLRDAEWTIKLVKYFVLALSEKTNFNPFT